MGTDEDEKPDMLQQSVFWWIGINEGAAGADGAKTKEKAHQTITAREIAEKHGVPRDIFMEYLAEEIDESEACLSLPFTILLVFIYTSVAIGHDKAALVNAVEDSIIFDIEENANFAWSSPSMGHKGFHDVNSHADFWSWLSLGFVPLVWNQGEGFSEGRNVTYLELMQAGGQNYPENSTGRGLLLHYNRIMGGILLQQEVSGDDEEPCVGTSMLLPAYGLECVHGKGYELDPETWTARESSDPQRIEWFFMNDNQSVVLDKVRQMEGEQWLDRKTKKIEIAIPVYNGEYGLYSLIMVNFFFSRGGHIWKEIIPLSTWANWHDSYTIIFYDLIWLLCLVWIIYSEAKEVYTLVNQRGFAAILKDYMNFWNAVDWASVYAGTAIIIMFHFNLVFTTELNDAAMGLGQMSYGNWTTFYDYELQIQDVFAKLKHEVLYCHKFRLVMAAYPLIIVFRLFKAFASQPRLAVVSRTMTEASVELLHFLLVFISVFGTFVISGILLFGASVESFTNAGRAINTGFRICLGDFDWDDLSVVGRMEAGVWFWCFNIILAIVMMNMLLAIVMDTYTTVKEKVVSAETLAEETRQVWREYWGIRNGELVPSSEVLIAIKEMKKPMPQDTTGEIHLVTVAWMQKSTKGLHAEQARDMLMSCITHFHELHKTEGDLEEAVQVLRKIDYRTKKWRQTVMSFHAGEDIELDEDEVQADDPGELPAGIPDAMARIRQRCEKVWHDLNDPEPDVDHGGRRKTIRSSVAQNPMTSIQDAEKCLGTAVRVLDSKEAVINACRAVGMNSDNDQVRADAAGSIVEVREVDPSDSTVRCHVPAIGDLWFAIGALTPLEATYALMDGPALDDLLTKEADLQEEVEQGRDAVAEALEGISQLQWQLVQAQQETTKVKSAMEKLKAKAETLIAANRAEKSKKDQQSTRIRTIKEATAEYNRLLKRLQQEQDYLNRRLVDCKTKPKDDSIHTRMDFLSLQCSRLQQEINAVHQSKVESAANVQQAAALIASRLESAAAKATAPLVAAQALRALSSEVDALAGTPPGVSIS